MDGFDAALRQLADTANGSPCWISGRRSTSG